MLNILFGVSITINIIFILGIFIYFKIKKSTKKIFNSNFCTDAELEDMLSRL